MMITNDEHIRHAVEAGAAIAQTCGDVGYVVTAMRRILGVTLSETVKFHVERPMVMGEVGHVSAFDSNDNLTTMAVFPILR